MQGPGVVGRRRDRSAAATIETTMKVNLCHSLYQWRRYQTFSQRSDELVDVNFVCCLNWRNNDLFIYNIRIYTYILHSIRSLSRWRMAFVKQCISAHDVSRPTFGISCVSYIFVWPHCGEMETDNCYSVLSVCLSVIEYINYKSLTNVTCNQCMYTTRSDHDRRLCRHECCVRWIYDR